MKIDGSKIANELLEQLKLQRQNLSPHAKLKIISFQNDVANTSYIKIKKEFATKLNIICEVHLLDSNKSSKELRKEINQICKEKNVAGAIIQLPIPSNLNKHTLINAIPENLDIDCLSYKNLGRFYQNKRSFVPPTVSAMDYLIKKFQLKMDNVLLIGQGELIGKPIAQYLLNNHIEFTIINHKTKDIQELCQKAGVIITGVGVPNLIQAKYIKKDAIIFDFGCTKQQKVCGDCEDNPDFENICSFFTPVPNGLGPIVVAKLFENLLKHKYQ